MARVFISYSRKNLDFVERLVKDLQDAGFEVWYDISGLEIGKRWVTEIEDAIKQSQYFIVILSPDSIKSEWVEREFLSAEKYKLKIIPLLFQSCDLPMWCNNLQYIDFQGIDYKLRFGELQKNLSNEEKNNTSDKLDCVILCGGYSQRLKPLTTEISKVLLPVAGKPILEFVIDFVQESNAVRKTIISVNEKYAPQIQKYLDHYLSHAQQNHPIEIIIEPSKGERNKLGPVGALQYIVSKTYPRDLIVLGGDNIFGFRLDEFLSIIPQTGDTCSYNAIYEYQDLTKNYSEYGMVDQDKEGTIVEFTEKPIEVVYKNISTACYLFKHRDVEAINEYLLTGGDPDSLGHFVHWLVKQRRISSFPFDTFWFDIGTREALLQANFHLLTHSISKTVEMGNNEWFEPVYTDTKSKIRNSKLGPNVYIGAEVQVIRSTISNSIIMDRCIITDCEVKDSVIGPESLIEEGQLFEGVYGTKK